MLSALTVSPSGRISVCSGSGVSSAREEPALHFRIRRVHGDCLSQPHTFIYLFIYFEPNQGQGGIFLNCFMCLMGLDKGEY